MIGHKLRPNTDGCCLDKQHLVSEALCANWSEGECLEWFTDRIDTKMVMMATSDEPPKANTKLNHELPSYNANDLTNGGQLAEIYLDDQRYTLRITKANIKRTRFSRFRNITKLNQALRC